jgi:hypothetical protein
MRDGQGGLEPRACSLRPSSLPATASGCSSAANHPSTRSVSGTIQRRQQPLPPATTPVHRFRLSTDPHRALRPLAGLGSTLARPLMTACRGPSIAELEPSDSPSHGDSSCGGGSGALVLSAATTGCAPLIQCRRYVEEADLAGARCIRSIGAAATSRPRWCPNR